MKNPHVIWASVVIVFLLVAPAGLLVAFNKDVTIILTLAGLVAIPILGAFGAAVYQKLDQVKESSNGNLTRVLEMQQKTQEQLHALAMSISANTPAVTREEEKPADDFASTLLLRPSGDLDRP